MTSSQLACYLNCRIPASPNCNDLLFFCRAGALTTRNIKRLYVLLVLTCCPGRPCCPCSPEGPWAGKVTQRRHYINFHTLSYSNNFDFLSGFTNVFPIIQSCFRRHIHRLQLKYIEKSFIDSSFSFLDVFALAFTIFTKTIMHIVHPHKLLHNSGLHTLCPKI